MKNRCLIKGIVLLAIIVEVSLSSCSRQAPPAEFNEYKTMQVASDSITVTTSYSAVVKGVQDVDIYPQVSGVITEIKINEGAQVHRGQVLFVIDQVPFRAKVETAKANLESAEAAMATAEMTVESKAVLAQENVVSDFDLQTAQNDLRKYKAAVALAKAELTNALNDLSYTEVKSPVNGVAGMIPYRIGALVSTSISEPLTTVSDNEYMNVYFSMSEKQILELSKQGSDSSSVSGWFPEVKLQLSDGSEYQEIGKVDAVSGIIDQKTGSVSIRARFANKSHLLRSGGACNVLIPEKIEGKILIPKESTFEIQDKVFVYKVVDGITKSTSVVLDRYSSETHYVVESGLTEGDVIIAEGAGLLRDGVKVNINNKEENQL